MFVKYFGILIVFVISLLQFKLSLALTLDLKAANVSEAITMIAEHIPIDVMISHNVQGIVTLKIQDATPLKALETLLDLQGLAKDEMNHIWQIAPRAEILARKQERLQWQQSNERFSPLQTKIWQVRYIDATHIDELLKTIAAIHLSARGHYFYDQRTNRILVQDSPDRLQKIQLLLNRFDVPIAQVMIAARIVTIDNDYEKELGLSLQGLEAKADGVVKNDGPYHLGIVKLAQGALLDVKLTALEKVGHAEVISRPSLFAANQQSAIIEAGEEVPYQEVSKGGATATTFKKAVLRLKVTPKILPDKKVLLQLQVNQDKPSNKMVLGVPTINTRQLKTSVIAKSGQTVILGGIYETDKEQGRSGQPFINHIPLIGLLFAQHKQKERKQELLIFITPTII
jgi:type IV pilus assembly protein PilQ